MDAAVDWEKLKKSVSYIESDSTAVIRDPNYNLVSWLPVHLNELTGEPAVSIDGHWQRAEDIPGFERFEQVKTKKLFDTATGELVPI